MHPRFEAAQSIIEEVFKKHLGYCYLYSANDDGDPAIPGTHMEASLHYAGCAGDYRTWTTLTSGEQISEAKKLAIVTELRKRLGEEFDVSWKRRKGGALVPKNHIHIEWQPKRMSLEYAPVEKKTEPVISEATFFVEAVPPRAKQITSEDNQHFLSLGNAGKLISALKTVKAGGNADIDEILEDLERDLREVEYIPEGWFKSFAGNRTKIALVLALLVQFTPIDVPDVATFAEFAVSLSEVGSAALAAAAIYVHKISGKFFAKRKMRSLRDR